MGSNSLSLIGGVGGGGVEESLLYQMFVPEVERVSMERPLR